MHAWRCRQIRILKEASSIQNLQTSAFHLAELTSILFKSSSKNLHLPSDSFSDSGMSGDRGFVVTAKEIVESNGKWVPIRKGDFITHMVKIEAAHSWRDLEMKNSTAERNQRTKRSCIMLGGILQP
jgi:hypothetical protein